VLFVMVGWQPREVVASCTSFPQQIMSGTLHNDYRYVFYLGVFFLNGVFALYSSHMTFEVGGKHFM